MEEKNIYGKLNIMDTPSLDAQLQQIANDEEAKLSAEKNKKIKEKKENKKLDKIKEKKKKENVDKPDDKKANKSDKKEPDKVEPDKKEQKPQKEAKKKTKEKLTAKRIVNLILDVVVFPILIFSSIFSLSLVITKKTKGVPMVFGYAMITVVSGSMQDAGFNVGDSAFIRQVAASELELGDYIAFFDYVDPDHPTPATVANGKKPTSSPKKDRIVFHEIVEIQVDANGDCWFRTKGTNNAATDYNIIYQDYVIGRYVEDGNALVGFMKFIHSSAGIIVLVAVPCSIILFRDCYELITIVWEYSDEKKRLKKERQQARDESLPTQPTQQNENKGSQS